MLGQKFELSSSFFGKIGDTKKTFRNWLTFNCWLLDNDLLNEWYLWRQIYWATTVNSRAVDPPRPEYFSLRGNKTFRNKVNFRMSSEIENLPNHGRSNNYFQGKKSSFPQTFPWKKSSFLKTFLWKKSNIFQSFSTCNFFFLSSIGNAVH